MTTRIVRKGVDAYFATCGGCGCEFTYEREDVHHNFLRGIEYVTCPQCCHVNAHHGAPPRPRRTWRCGSVWGEGGE